MKFKKYTFCLIFLPFSLFGIEHITLQLRWLHQFQFAGYYMAKYKGYYQDVGLDVTIKEANNDHRHPLTEVLSNRAEYGVGNAGLIAERIQGKPVVALAVLFQTSPNVWILRKDSDIATIVDLANKRLMMTKNIENTELLALFSNEGIDIAKLDIVESSFNIDDLIDKKVDAFNGYSTNEPYYLEQKGVEYTIIDPRRYGIDFYSDTLFTSQNELKEHPMRVKSFYDASMKGWEYALANPEETIDVILKHYSQAKTKEHLRFEARAICELIQPKFIEIGHMNPSRWRYIAKTYKQLGFISSDVVPSDFLYNQNIAKDYSWLFLVLGIAFILIVIIGGVAFYIYRLNRKIKEQAIRDPITGLYNRYYLNEILPSEIAGAARESYFISLIILDLDYFKNVNDTYGHAGGDIVLKTIATILKNTLRSSDFVFRFGGEEFLIVMPKTNYDQALKRIDECRQKIQTTPIVYNNHMIYITISGGVATYDLHGKTQDEVIKAADDALYVSKAHGRNQITLAAFKETL